MQIGSNLTFYYLKAILANIRPNSNLKTVLENLNVYFQINISLKCYSSSKLFGKFFACAFLCGNQRLDFSGLTENNDVLIQAESLRW